MLITLCDLNCGGSSMRYALGLMMAMILNGPYHRSSKTVRWCHGECAECCFVHEYEVANVEVAWFPLW